MPVFRSFFTLGLASGVFAALLGGEARAAQVLSPVAGGFRQTIPSASETWISVPLERRPVYTARVAGVLSDRLIIASDAMVALDPNAFDASAGQPRYYLRFCTGALAGLCYPVSSNSGTQIVLATSGDNLTAHPLGAISTSQDVIRVYPVWNIGTLLGATANEAVLTSTSAAPGPVYLGGDVALLPDVTNATINKAPAAQVAYVNGSGWRASDMSSGTDAASRPILPGQPLGIRRGTAVPLTFTRVGYVPTRPGVLRLPAVAAGGTFDLPFGLLQPGRLTLSAAGLSTVLKVSASAHSPGDALLMPPDEKGMATPAGGRLQWTGSVTGWREGEAGAGDVQLVSGQTYVLRFRGAPASQFWRQVLASQE